MNRNQSLFLVAATTLGLALGAWAQDAPPPPPPFNPTASRAAEIHDACSKGGVKVTTVRQHADGTYEVVCDGADRAKAAEIMKRVLDTPAPGQTPAKSLQDALVVLRFEPQNKAAHDLVQKRYQELRQKHLRSLKGLKPLKGR